MCVVLNSDRSKGKIKLEMATGRKRDIHLKTEWKCNGLCLGRSRFLTAVNGKEKNTLGGKKSILKNIRNESNCPWDHRVGYDLVIEQDNKETPFMKVSSHDLITF